MGLLMGPAPKNAVVVIANKVQSENPRPVDYRGEQGKAFKAFAKCLDRLSFDSHEFGYMMTLLSPAIQNRILSAFMGYFRIMSERVDNGILELMDDDTLVVTQNAHAVYQAIKDLPLTRE